MYGEWMDAIPLIIGEEWSKDYDRNELGKAANYWERQGDLQQANEIREVMYSKYV